ncbi:MAG TPA: SRPBCC domain-containing protein [Saprospiraceae bacterium]|nr:SRPBCC domain-containing protein [Saprospiraceae bacterium]
METKSISQTVKLSGTPEEVYQLLMDPEKYSSFTGSEVIISDKIKGEFNLFDGYITGYNIELIVGKKIVQAWHFEEDGWPKEHYSICTFIFEPDGNKTKLNFLQTDVPEHKIQALSKGWYEYYWEPMEEYLLQH